MKKITLIVALLLTAMAAQSALIIDTDFSAAAVGGQLTQGFENKLWSSTSANSTADAGWFRGASSFAIIGGQLETYTSVYQLGGVSPFKSGFGQVNTGNAGITGNVSFDVVVDSVNVGGGETMYAEFEIFGWTGGTSAFNTSITVENDVVGSNWTLLGSATTANITAAGTYTTGLIDMGAGYDQVAVRIEMIDETNSAWRDSNLISSISQTAVPEPATVGMLGLGALVALAIRRIRK